MKTIRFGPDEAQPVQGYASRNAGAVELGSGRGASHFYCLHFGETGEIGPHTAGFDQLFLVVQGEGWVADEHDKRIRLVAGQGVHVAKGEVHSKGSDSKMMAIMIQVDELSD